MHRKSGAAASTTTTTTIQHIIWCASTTEYAPTYGKGGLDAVPENKYQGIEGTVENNTLKSLIDIKYFEPKDEAVNYNELYDLQTDPNELNNLYGKPGYEKITKQLQKQLDAYRKAQKVDEY